MVLNEKYAMSNEFKIGDFKEVNQRKILKLESRERGERFK